MPPSKTKKSLPKKGSFVISNNDIVYLWWSIPDKIKDCLGFSIHRIVNGKMENKALSATVGFDAVKDKRKSPQTTDEWPIQSFNWKDLYAPHDKDIQYKIIPMTGDWENLKPDNKNAITTDKVRRTQVYGGDVKVIFNRGLLSTQAFSKAGGTDGVSSAEARKLIEDPSSVWRKRLSGQMLYNFGEFFGRAKKNGGKYNAALYELTDIDLINHLKNSAECELILSNANGSVSKTVDGKKKTVAVNDKTNMDVRKELHKLMKTNKKFKIYDRMLGTHIGHNKFIVYSDKKGKPQAVLTGSTNWTATGLCGQTNNMVIIESPKIAGHYIKYWNQLKSDKKQDKVLRTWCEKNSFESPGKSSKVMVWYSPNTKLKSKGKNAAAPIDIKEVFDLISKAKKSVLFLVFNPGSPSILDQIKATALKRKNDPLFVRGAISDAKIADKVTNEIYSSDALKKPDKYSYDMTGVSAIPGKFSYWERELLKIGFATIHDKIMVIDPFDKNNCAVITGSHNLGYKASYTNDENMLIIRNSPEIAQAYAAHILDVVNHFKWRYHLQSKINKAIPKAKASKMSKAKLEKEKEKVLKKEWNDLDEKDKWMDRYFKDGYIDQYRLFLR